MSTEESFRTPYTPTPGGSIPSAETTPTEGKHELWSFFWLALLNTAIIAVAGVVTWWFVR
ncbi:MAG TPA: hypothetical protein VEG66_08485 [Thermoplasmata archaeon]|jgi:hypothetical protein|nr:hypothetical protein [Thermoplasmata archaeon]